MRILFVDNHLEFTRAVIEQFLVAHEVVVTSTISAAKEQAMSRSFDIVLVDYDLDDGRGDELVRWLRSVGTHATLVAISARDLGNEALVAAGADAVCRKLEFSKITTLIDELAARTPSAAPTSTSPPPTSSR